MTNLLFNRLTAIGKRLAMVLTMLLIVGIGQVWGETATNNCGSALSATATDMESEKLIQWKVSSTNSYGNPIRVYANTTITITAKSGVKRITQVEVTASSTGNYVTNTEGAIWTASGKGTCTVGTKSVSGKVITVPMNGDVTTVTIKPSVQTRWSKVVVTYELDASCDKKVTLTKGLETNGTFTLDKANGSYDNCDENFVVKVSNIKPKSASQYCSGINVTGGNSSVTGPVDGVWTVTYTKENNITSTITPVFANKASASIAFVNMGTPAPTTTGYYVGDTYTLPSENDFTCGDKTFVGWSTVTIDNSAGKPASNFYEPGTEVTLEEENTFYAVFATASGSGASGDYELVTSAPDDWSGTYLIVDGTSKNCFNGSLRTLDAGGNYVSVTISNDKISSNSTTDSYSVSISKSTTSGQYYIQTSSGYYIGSNAASPSDGNELDASTSTKYDNSISISSKNVTIKGPDHILKFFYQSGQSWRFRFYKSTTTQNVRLPQLYRKTGGTSYSDYTTSCTTETSRYLTPKHRGGSGGTWLVVTEW